MNSLPARPIDQLNAFAQELHRQRKEWAARVHRWQWIAISSAAGSMLGLIVALAHIYDAKSDLERDGAELVYQLEETLKLLQFMQQDIQELQGQTQHLRWRLDRQNADM